MDKERIQGRHAALGILPASENDPLPELAVRQFRDGGTVSEMPSVIYPNALRELLDAAWALKEYVADKMPSDPAAFTLVRQVEAALEAVEDPSRTSFEKLSAVLRRVAEDEEAR